MRRKLLLLGAQYAGLLLLAVTVNFFVVYLVPGDPLDVVNRSLVESGGGRLSDRDQQIFRRYYGLDQPLGHQYAAYLGQLARGDLGYSFFFHRPTGEIIREYGRRTLLIVAAGMALALALGIPLGAISAAHRGRPFDTALLLGEMALHSMPPFFIATVLLIVFSVELRWAPFSGSAVLPIATLALWESTTIYYFTRNSLTGVMEENFIRTARAKGLNRRQVLWGHALPAVLPTLVARFALMFGVMIGGVFFAEQVFSYPGLALLALGAFHNQDYLLLRAVFLFLTLAIVGANFTADLAMYWLDPRTREAS